MLKSIHNISNKHIYVLTLLQLQKRRPFEYKDIQMGHGAVVETQRMS